LSGQTQLSRKAGAVNAVDGSEVIIDVSGEEYLGSDLQYRYSLNGNPFSLWRPRSEIRLTGLQPGDHEVVVCSRDGLGVEDPDCAAVQFTVAAAE
jgi:hypothetical protein